GADEIQHSQEGFLANVLNEFPRTQAIPHRQSDNVAEMRHEMPFRLRIAVAEPREVLVVKGGRGQKLRILDIMVPECLFSLSIHWCVSGFQNASAMSPSRKS